MSLTERVTTDERPKSVALEYLKAFDNGGVTSTGESILELFAPDAQAYFPTWGIAHGKEEIDRLFGDVGGTLRAIRHEYAAFNRIFSGSDVLVTEGTSYGEHRDGPWRAGVPDSGAGRWCEVFEIRDWLDQLEVTASSRTHRTQEGHGRSVDVVVPARSWHTASVMPMTAGKPRGRPGSRRQCQCRSLPTPVAARW
jgi:hypothetical protein